MKGKFNSSTIKEYSVTCVACEEMFVIHWPTKKQAQKSAREEGWKTRNGLWYCPNHVEHIAPATGGG